MALMFAVQTPSVVNADTIPPQTHEEAGHLAAVELERLLATIAAISDDAWDEPTDCTLWNVRQMVAHLAGACAGHTSLAEFRRQYISNPLYSEFTERIDAVNNLQVADRAGRSTAELLDELQTQGPQAIRVRQRIPWLVRQMRLPLGPLGLAPVGYLTDTIYTRDWWMHRADLCRATGQHMVLTPQHDGRIVALVLRDLARKLAGNPQPATVDLHLSSNIALAFRFGDKPQPEAEISMNLIAFNRLASGRIGLEQALALAEISGSTVVGRAFLANSEIPY